MGTLTENSIVTSGGPEHQLDRCLPQISALRSSAAWHSTLIRKMFVLTANTSPSSLPCFLVVRCPRRLRSTLLSSKCSVSGSLIAKSCSPPSSALSQLPHRSESVSVILPSRCCPTKPQDRPVGGGARGVHQHQHKLWAETPR